MKVMIRLYRQHDLDLIGLYYNPEFAFRKALKETLINYVRGQYYRIDIPHIGLDGSVKKQIPLHIILDEKSEADVIEWLKNTTKGQRNSMIKNLFRGYVIGANIYPYRLEDDVSKVFYANTDKIKSYKKDNEGKKYKRKQPSMEDLVLITKPTSAVAHDGKEDMLDDFDALMGSFQ